MKLEKRLSRTEPQERQKKQRGTAPVGKLYMCISRIEYSYLQSVVSSSIELRRV